jgi:3D (Asp-Asp-Asp) domain-containing protein
MDIFIANMRRGARIALPVLFLLCLSCPPLAVSSRVRVSAYCHRHRTATGGTPHRGTCAGPKSWLGCYVHVPGKGVYKVTDTCRHGFDLWMPSRKACRRWGHRTLSVRVERPGKHRRHAKPKFKTKSKRGNHALKGRKRRR